MTGIIVFAHGSSVESANEAVRTVVAQMREHHEFPLLEAAFLEGGQPSLEESVSNLHGDGATSIVIIPYFLTLGLHLKRDLPRLVDEIRVKYPSLVEIRVTEPLDGHPALVNILLDRAEAACKAHD